jgi:hypothetical protein
MAAPRPKPAPAAFLESNRAFTQRSMRRSHGADARGGSAVIKMRQAQLETASSVMSVTAALTAGL